MPNERQGGAAWLVRPAVVFSLLAAVVLAAVLLTPREPEGAGDARLTTHSAGPHGARGFYETAGRLGWRAERLEAPLPAGPRADGTHVVYAVLDPRRFLTAAETHRLLDAVRAGAGLLVVPRRETALADSLGLRVSSAGGILLPPPRPACPPGAEGPQAIAWPDGRIHSWWLTPERALGDTAAFLAVRRPPVRLTEVEGREVDEEELPGDSIVSPAGVGFSLGAGRVVAVADPDLLRNDVIRVCRWGAGVAAVRMLGWLGGGRAPNEVAVVFDEYHHGYDASARRRPPLWRSALAAPLGRTLLQVAAAALVLLLALGPRPLAPPSRARVQRRSALEHVGALARAYEQVGATRTAARMLVRGLRRRHVRAGWARPGADDDFLVAIAAARPALAADVARVRAAVSRPVDPAELLAVGQAAARIDRALGE